MKIMDRREIEFEPPSVVKAIITSPQAAQGFGLPALKPIDIRFRPEDGCVDVIYGTANRTRAFPLSAEALGAILIAYCVRSHIPTPKAADKAIRIEARSVVLSYRVQLDEAPTPTTGESAGRSPVPFTAWKLPEA